jgi:hypothetical protein
LRVIETKFGRLGCLLCWEYYMPLARYALYAQRMDILVAITWDCGDCGRRACATSQKAMLGLSSATALRD